MLVSLSITNFALIPKLHLEFGGGLNVLLGETGAGKSIIIDALSVALGERTSSDIVPVDAKKCIVEATFQNISFESVSQVWHQDLLDWDSDALVLRREISNKGTSRCFVNDTPVSASVVKALASVLMDFHGQHDTYGLLNISEHRALFDVACGNTKLLSEMHTAYSEYADAKEALVRLQQQEANADEERVRLQFRYEELEQIRPEHGEIDRIAQELRRFEQQEQLVQQATALHELVYGSDIAAYTSMKNAQKLLSSLTRFDDSLERYSADLESASIICQEVAHAIAPYIDPSEFSAESLEELRIRMQLLQRLQTRYGSLEEAIAQQEFLKGALENLADISSHVADAEKKVALTLRTATEVAKKLTAARKQYAAVFSAAIGKALHAMEMPAAEFSTQLPPSELGVHGAENIEFLFTSNPGQPLRSLGKIASGGELSRVMLAVKSVMAEQNTHATLVLDEIDTGISGKAARHVGTVMQAIAETNQMICITHLAQIASLADVFIKVTKTQSKNSTVVHAQRLDESDAIVEVAQLLSGTQLTNASLDGAKELMRKPNARKTARRT